ncbi:crotonase/enoyl-CoA hydratase family protein [Antarctobacter heliothermus]|uniref:Enoyl-CoA hydratase/carnithine racemase n=1 Tax=Antarctobacter heliothermus TaxID=74033 RepID=A0A239FHE0_9RHOB|nr:crotonase/enoyl-CoA hydratase family protein [Antarctobacter heliothermus]SNS56450.1 Enoyl-CoA hydratase/carnithine racemase [Antarctobacter heliothermus]
MSNSVIVTRDGPVAEVVLNRPEKHNAVDLSVFEGLARAGEDLKRAEGLRAVILRGEGPNFCSGIDTSLFTANPDPKALIGKILELSEGESANMFQKPCTVWQELEVPVIAALTGVNYGAGLQIALGADIRLAASDTRLSVMEITWGLIPDMGITTTLLRLMRADQAKELIFTGRIVEAVEAAALGLVTRLCADPLAEARAMAQTIAAKNPDAIRRDKRLVDEAWHMDRAAALRLEAVLQSEVIGQPNQLEAVFARIQKRAPNFR